MLFFIYVCPAQCELPGLLSDNNYYPTADAYTYEKNDSTAGSFSELYVGYQNAVNFGNIRSALRFDISEIPENTKIKKAYLFIYAVDDNSALPFPSIQVYPAPSRWTESSLSWAQLSDITASVYESSFVAGISGSSPASFFWDITDIVQSWVSEKENYGIVLQCDSENFDDYIRIYSRENLLFKPCLNVSYTSTPLPADSHLSGNTSETDTSSRINDTDISTEFADKLNGTETSPSNAISIHTDKISPNNAFSGNTPGQEKQVPPEITTSPSSRIINPNDSVTFSIVSSGTPPLSFQWVKDGEKLTGETFEIHTISSATEKDEGIYSCIVSNEAGSMVSNGAELLVNDPPGISSHPETRAVNPGNSATLSVIASGTPPLSFQWMKDGDDITGETSENYTIHSAIKTNEGIYSCSVTNDAGSINSEGAELLVNDPPDISRHPESQLKNYGMPASFSVSASGTTPLSFQWLKDGERMDNETSESITIDSVSENSEGFYSCRITNIAGSIESEGAPLYVVYPPDISRHPESQLKNHGTPASFSVNATGAPPLSFQWLKDGKIIENETSESITINSVSKNNEGFYSCRITNDAGSIESDAAQLYVVYPPKITTQPQSQQKQLGQPADFAITADGTGPFSYQWNKDRMDIPGATSNTYTIAAVNKENEGTYSCEVRNNFSRIVSSEARLTIVDPDAEVIFESDEIPGPESGISDSEAIPANADNHINSTPSAKSSEDIIKNSISASSKNINISNTVNDNPNKKARPSLVNLTLAAPDGQGTYVHNGDILTCSGTASSHSVILSARLVDGQERLIRNASRSLTLDSKSGEISGSIFVGSFRRAASVHLLITVQDSAGNRSDINRSNILLVDNTYPEISVTAPKNLSYHINAPIIIQGIASDSLSGINSVEISLDGGVSYFHVDSYKNGNWRYEFSPAEMNGEYQLKIRVSDRVGLSTISDPLTIKYAAHRPEIQKTAKAIGNSPADHSGKKAVKANDDNGICTYRITDFTNNRFQEAETFRLKEEMAIIVKGYGGNAITIRILEPPSKKVLMELVDYIPDNKHKMWKWKLSKTGTFQAALFVDGIQQDDVYFKIIQ